MGLHNLSSCVNLIWQQLESYRWVQNSFQKLKKNFVIKTGYIHCLNDEILKKHLILSEKFYIIWKILTIQLQEDLSGRIQRDLTPTSIL